jgi:uncharacterized membrane-anchored protein YitT (DUF2179 family)
MIWFLLTWLICSVINIPLCIFCTVKIDRKDFSVGHIALSIVAMIYGPVFIIMAINHIIEKSDYSNLLFRKWKIKFNDFCDIILIKANNEGNK